MEKLHTVGPYRLESTLGEGGMGVVYHAIHRQTGQLAALKTVRVMHSARLAGIRREIRALASLRHPSIVRIYDHGVHDGLPWYAMEYLQGISLRDHVFEVHEHSLPQTQDSAQETRDLRTTRPYRSSEVGDAPLNLPDESIEEFPLVRREQLPLSLALVHQLCLALAYLHGEGLVHRDLKPENVFVVDDNRLVLMDFGLAFDTSGGVGRETMTSGFHAGGTAYYMPPEQIEGRWLDARTDLYALGCILYETITGRPPFYGGSAMEVMAKQIQEPAVPPSSLTEGIPPELDELVLALLAKRPEERPGYAEDVAATLAEICPEIVEPTGLPEPRTYLYRPALAGRKSALRWLSDLLADVGHGQGSLCFLGGESGIGKTRLALECIHQKPRRLEVYIGTCAPLGNRQGGGALHPLRTAFEAIADKLREAGPTMTRQVLGREGPVLARYEPALAELPGMAEMPAPAELPPNEAQLRVYLSLLRVFGRLTEKRPILLVLDDLQRADELTMGWLQFMARSRFKEQKRLMLLGIFRSEERPVALEELLAQPELDQMTLQRLDEEAVAEIVRSMLAMPEAPQAFVNFLHRQSEGNPFFVAEYLRTAVAAGLLTRDNRGHWDLVDRDGEELDFAAIGLPTALKELVLRRLDSLSGEAVDTAQLAAVFGRAMDSEMFTGACDEQLLSGLDELVRREILEFANDGSLLFVHDKLRTVIYGGLQAARRNELHRIAATAMSQGDTHDRLLAQRGHHWEFANEIPKAIDCYRRAAIGAFERYDTGEAKQLFLACLALQQEPGADSIDVRLRLARVLLDRGETHGAASQADQAFDEAKAAGLQLYRGRAYLLLAEINRLRGDIDDALWQLEQSGQLFRALDEPDWEARQLSLLSQAYSELGNYSEAESCSRKALEINRRSNNRSEEGETLGNLSILYFLRARYSEGLELLTVALKIHRETGDRRAEGQALNIMASSYHEQGHIDRAVELRSEALTIHRELGQRRLEGQALSNLAIASYQRGDLDEAQRLLDEGMAVHRDVGNRRYEGTTLTTLALVTLDRGEFEQAEALFDEALAVHHEVGHLIWQSFTLISQASLFRRQGYLQQSAEALLSADLVFGEVDDLYGKALYHCQVGHLALARGESAATELQAARAIADQLNITEESEPGRAIRLLEQALNASEAGEPVYMGERVADLAPGIVLTLVKRGLLRV